MCDIAGCIVCVVLLGEQCVVLLGEQCVILLGGLCVMLLGGLCVCDCCVWVVCDLDVWGGIADVQMHVFAACVLHCESFDVHQSVDYVEQCVDFMSMQLHMVTIIL